MSSHHNHTHCVFLMTVKGLLGLALTGCCLARRHLTLHNKFMPWFRPEWQFCVSSTHTKGPASVQEQRGDRAPWWAVDQWALNHPEGACNLWSHFRTGQREQTETNAEYTHMTFTLNDKEDFFLEEWLWGIRWTPCGSSLQEGLKLRLTEAVSQITYIHNTPTWSTLTTTVNKVSLGCCLNQTLLLHTCQKLSLDLFLPFSLHRQYGSYHVWEVLALALYYQWEFTYATLLKTSLGLKPHFEGLHFVLVSVSGPSRPALICYSSTPLMWL